MEKYEMDDKSDSGFREIMLGTAVWNKLLNMFGDKLDGWEWRIEIKNHRVLNRLPMIGQTEMLGNEEELITISSHYEMVVVEPHKNIRNQFMAVADVGARPVMELYSKLGRKLKDWFFFQESGKLILDKEVDEWKRTSAQR